MIAFVVLTGDKVRLRPVSRDDLPSFLVWLSDADVTHHLGVAHLPQSLADEEEWFNDAAEDDASFHWAIETLDCCLLGNIRLTILDADSTTGELGVMIGDKSRWDKGYGTDAIRTLLDHAFSDLGLHRVQLTVDEDNYRGIRCYEKCGFRREGLLRENRRLPDGRLCNSLIMGILDREFCQATDQS